MREGEEIAADSSRGSNAIVAMVRSQLGIDKPDKDSDWCRLQMLKENLGLRPKPIGFRVTSKGIEFGEAPEKPDKETLAAMPRPLWVSMNCWRFTPSIFEACRNIPPSPRGELEVTAAVQYAIDTLGERFRALKVRAAVLDLTSRQDIAPVAARLAEVEVHL